MKFINAETFENFIKSAATRELVGCTYCDGKIRQFRFVKSTIVPIEGNGYAIEGLYGTATKVGPTDISFEASDLKFLAFVAGNRVYVNGSIDYNILCLRLSGVLKNKESAGLPIDQRLFDVILPLTYKKEKTVFERTVSIRPSEAEEINSYLSGENMQSEDNTISITIEYDDGMQMDIKCCGGGDDVSWTEAVLFAPSYLGGGQVACTDADDTFVQTWEIEYGNRVYRAIVDVAA